LLLTGPERKSSRWRGCGWVRECPKKKGKIQAFFILAFATKPALSM
jgi:hypothetical protein